MTDGWGPPPEPPEPLAARGAGGLGAGCVVWLVAMFLVGFVGVGALLFLRAPDRPRTTGESPLVALLQEPPGYVALPDATSGGGRLSEGSAAALLHRPGVPGYRDGVLRAWGRPAGQPPRAVVVLIVEVRTASMATQVRNDYVDTQRDRGAAGFVPAPLGPGAAGLREPADASGRHAQRVVFSRGNRVFVVSVVTPEPETGTTEVVALAARQADAAS